MTGKESAMPPDGRMFWKGYYGKEPFDLRLTVLRMLYRIPVIAAATALGVLVFGGGYYVKNVLLRSERLYAATSVYRVEYHVDSEQELQNCYINAMSWNTYLQSRMFQEMLQSRLADGTELTEQELTESMEAFLWSDLRVPAVTVTTEEPGKTEEIMRAVDKVMTEDFSLREIDSIAVIDPGRAEEVIPDVRVGRAVILSALLSCFFAVIVLLLKETGDDGIWLPGTIWKRYGVRAAGTLESRELAQNLQYFFREKGSGEAGTRRIAVCMVQERMEPEKVLAGLRERCPETVDSSWYAVDSPITEPGNSALLREADGILLAVKAGCRGGRKLEYVLEYLEQQDCEVTAVLLWEADEKLIKRYYFGRAQRSTGIRGRKGKSGKTRS